MPPKKKSRAASRCKPVLLNITNKMSAVEAKKHEKKRQLILDDFTRNVSLQMEKLREEQKQLEESLWRSYRVYRSQLEPWHHVTLAQLQQNEDSVHCKKSSTSKPVPAASESSAKPLATLQEKDEHNTHEQPSQDQDAPVHQDAHSLIPIIDNLKIDAPEESDQQVPTNHEEEADSVSSTSKDPRMSDISALLAETYQKFAKTTKTKKKAAAATPALDAAGTRTSSRSRKPSAKIAAATTSMAVPPATARAARNRKVDVAPFITPAGQRVFPGAAGAKLMVTPKFDPRLPLPPGTIKRKLLPNEVAMSITGSPISVSPPKPQLEKIMSTFLNTLEQEAPSVDIGELQRFQARLCRYINSKPSV